MSKRLLIIIAIAVGIGMMGLLMVQTYWIKSAYKLKEKQFDQRIGEALDDFTKEIEKREATDMLMDEIDFMYNDPRVNNIPMGSFDTTIQLEILNEPGFQFRQDFYFSHDMQSNKTKSRLREIRGSDTIILYDSVKEIKKPGNPDFFSNHFPKNAMNSQLNHRRKLMDQMINKMFQFNPEIEYRLPPNKMKKTLEDVLKQHGIDIEFEYAVTKWNRIMAYKSKDYDMDIDEHLYRVKLFPHDFFTDGNYLSIYFPEKKNFIMRSLGIMSMTSSLLTLFILIIFTTTLFIIFRQKKLSEMKNDFVNNMTHELKTPISTISLASQMLNDNSIPAQSKNMDQISKIILEESNRLGYQVEKVLQMAIFEKGRLKLKFKETDMHELLENAVENFAIQAESKNGVIIPSFHATHFTVSADHVHMTNVIANLLDNAIKYSGKQPEIFVESRNEKGKLLVVVKDNGIGISRGDQQKIFERFYRVSTGNIHDVKGFGLGLSYVKKIIEEHRGTIEVDSDTGKGTAFIIHLPYQTKNYGEN